MSDRQDEDVWRNATSFLELRELNARFIEGDLKFHPDYSGDGLNSESDPIAKYLAAFSRAGFLTTGSQPGVSGPDYKQRAWVEGFASERVALRLERLDLISSLYVMVATPRDDAGTRIAVTVDRFRKFTEAGCVEWKYALQEFEKECSEEALNALKSSYYACVIDLEWGRENYLWETVAQELHSVEPDPQWPTYHRDLYLARQIAAIREYKDETKPQESEDG